MSAVEADFSTLISASKEWEGASDKLDGSWRRLAATNGGSIAPDVSAAFVDFRETWVDRIKEIARQAERHAESLDDAVRDYATADQAALQRMRSLLPFQYRDSSFSPLLPGPDPLGYQGM